MSTIVLDADLRAKLNGLNERMEVRNEAGEFVGQFLPADEYKRLLAKTIEIPFSDEEIEQFRKSGGGCSLQDIWKKLGVQ